MYVLRSNTVTQMESSLADIFQIPAKPTDTLAEAIAEAQEAIRKVLNGAPAVDLRPQSAEVRRQQHQLARAANLVSHSYGREPFRHVRIYRE